MIFNKTIIPLALVGYERLYPTRSFAPHWQSITSYPTRTRGIIVNYWMRLSWIWRILQVEEGVIHQGRRPRRIKPSESCRILHILRKLNSIIGMLYNSLKIFSLLKLVNPLAAIWIRSLLNSTTSSPGFLGQRFNNLQRAALLTSFCQTYINQSPSGNC